VSRLQDISSVLRSKNAGPLYLTLDVMLPDEATFRRVLAAGVLDNAVVAALYGVPIGTVAVIPYPPSHTIKVTMHRPIIAGDPEDTDLYGAQQYVPLFDLEVPD
jgi:hypothetical protein